MKEFLIPLINKTFPTLVANDIISVQPMSECNNACFEFIESTPEQIEFNQVLDDVLQHHMIVSIAMFAELYQTGARLYGHNQRFDDFYNDVKDKYDYLVTWNTHRILSGSSGFMTPDKKHRLMISIS